MNYWIVILLFSLSGCANWKKNEFDKEISKQADGVSPNVDGDAKILEKFEVKPFKVEKPVEAPSLQKKKVTSKQVRELPSKIISAPAALVTTVKKTLPADYPLEVTQLNEKAQKVWDLYKSNHFVNEKNYLDIHYLGMTVGKIMVTNKGKKMINGKEVWHFHARFKSAPFYSSIYELDDTVDTYVTTDQFLSIRYSLIQRETKMNVDDLQLNDRDQLKSFWFYKQKKSDGDIRNKQKENFIPYYSIDPFSMLFFYQGLPLKDGDVYEIPIINKAKILILKSEVEGREEISTEKGRQKAIRVHATTKYTGETLKSGDMYFWFSDDQHKTLLKAKAKIKIGSVTADIVDN